MKKLLALVLLSSSLVLTGCGPSTTFTMVKAEDVFPNLTKAQPKSILVLPAKNTTTSVDATNHFRYSITQPLAEKGYYVFPVSLVDSFFKSENLSEADMIRNIPPQKLREIFGADAILFVDINAWDTSYTVLNSSVDVGVSFELIDAKTGKNMWQNNAYAYSMQGLDGNNGLVGLLVSAVQTAVNTGVNYSELAYVANTAGFTQLPKGPYHSNYASGSNVVISSTAELKGDRLYVSEYIVKGVGSEENVALKARIKQKGYHAFSSYNLNDFIHNGYNDYYLPAVFEDQAFMKNRFFMYEGTRPFLFTAGKKVFLQTDEDGRVPYSEEDGEYYFQAASVIDLATK